MQTDRFDILLESLHHSRKFLVDGTYSSDKTQAPVILFIHGFKGFKDWGPFNLMAKTFAEEGFVFLKCNLSHNGTTPEKPTDFADLEAFGQNTFSIELDDIGVVLDAISNRELPIEDKLYDPSRIFLMGHSRGGGLVILKAHEDDRVKGIMTLAPIHNLKERWKDEVVAEWKKKGVQYIPNSRTGQQMPLYYSLYEDVIENEQRLNIPRAARALSIPWFIAYGTEDETLDVTMGHHLKAWNPDATLMIVEGATMSLAPNIPGKKSNYQKILGK